MPQVTSMLFCFNYLTAYAIEAITIALSCFGILNLYLTKIILPWYADSSLENKIFIFSNLFFFIIIISLTISILTLRYKSLININYNNIGFYISIVSIFSSLFGLVATLFIYVLLMANMNYYNDENSNAGSSKKKNIITYNDWAKTIISMILSSLIWIMLLFLTISENLRIDLKIDDSYYQYLRALDEGQRDYGPQNNVSEVFRKYKDQSKKKLKESTSEKMINKNGEDIKEKNNSIIIHDKIKTIDVGTDEVVAGVIEANINQIGKKMLAGN